MSVGAYTAANLANAWARLAGQSVGRRPDGRLIGAIVGIPSLRIKGLYLASPRCRPAHHRVDDQPRDVHQWRRAGLDRRGQAAAGR